MKIIFLTFLVLLCFVVKSPAPSSGGGGGSGSSALTLLNEANGTYIAEPAESYFSYNLPQEGDVSCRYYGTNECNRVLFMSCAEPITDMALVYQNYQGVGGFYSGISGLYGLNTNLAPIVIQCAVEYPNGVFHPFTFGGASIGVCQTNSIVQTDLIKVGIPPNTLFYIRTFASQPSMPFQNGIQVPASFEDFSANWSISDTFHGPSYSQTTAVGSNDITVANLYNPAANMGYVAAQGLSYYAYEPAAIIGSGHKAAIALFGDSISTYCTYNSASQPTSGFIYAGIATNIPVIGMNMYGNKLAYELTNANAHVSVALKGCNIAICQLGINDYATAGTFTYVTNLWTQFWLQLSASGLKVFQTTLSPVTASSDSWATTGNQSIIYNVSALNDWVRKCPPPLSGYVEVADTVMTSRNSGIWKATGGALGYTIDGEHPSQLGATTMAVAIASWANGQRQNTFVGGFTGTFTTTNGVGLTATIPVWTNTLATHGYYIQVTNGIIVGYPVF